MESNRPKPPLAKDWGEAYVHTIQINNCKRRLMRHNHRVLTMTHKLIRRQQSAEAQNLHRWRLCSEDSYKQNGL